MAACLRVRGCYALLVSILDYASEHKDDMVDLVADIDRATVARGLDPGEDDTFGIEFDVRADKTYAIRGYDLSHIGSRWQSCIEPALQTTRVVKARNSREPVPN